MTFVSVPALTPLDDGLQVISWNTPFSPQFAFGQCFVIATDTLTMTHSEFSLSDAVLSGDVCKTDWLWNWVSQQRQKTRNAKTILKKLELLHYPACVCTCLYVFAFLGAVYTCVHVCVEARDQTWPSSLVFHFISWESFSLIPRACWFAGSLPSKLLVINLSLPPQPENTNTCIPIPEWLCRCWGSDSCLHGKLFSIWAIASTAVE